MKMKKLTLAMSLVAALFSAANSGDLLVTPVADLRGGLGAAHVYT